MPPTPQVEILTVGTRHGNPPTDHALLVDLTHRLRNPATDPALRGLTGLDPALAAHVLATPGAETVVRALVDQVLALTPHHPAPLRMVIQCHWGRHRSVAVAEEVALRLRAKDVSVAVQHRDIDQPPLRREDGCAFCDIAHGDAPAEIVREWEEAIAIRPRSGGVDDDHVLILPKVHVADATVHPQTTGRVMVAAAEYAAQVDGDLNIITSKGESATQTVFHLHVHVVPRRPGDRLRLPWTPRWFDQVITFLRILGRHTRAPLEEQPAAPPREEDPVIYLGSGGPEGWWDGMRRFGPGYTPGPVQMRTTFEPWPHMDGTVATCPRCQARNHLSLLWPDSRPDLAHLMCPWCQSAWPDLEWSGTGPVARVLQEPVTGGPGEQDEDDIAPEVAYLTEYLRRMAGNTTPAAE